MSVTPYEQVPTSHIARSDQVLAGMSDRATGLSKAVVVAVYPEPGEVCGIRSCGLLAVVVAAALYGLPERTDVPLCEGHYDKGNGLQPILALVMQAKGYTAEPGALYVEATA